MIALVGALEFSKSAEGSSFERIAFEKIAFKKVKRLARGGRGCTGRTRIEAKGAGVRTQHKTVKLTYVGNGKKMGARLHRRVSRGGFCVCAFQSFHSPAFRRGVVPALRRGVYFELADDLLQV